MSETVTPIAEPIVCPVVEPEVPAYSKAILMAAKLLRQFEGCVLHPYQDTGGTWTIGIGSIWYQGARVTKDTPTITDEEAQEMMEGELVKTATAVDGMLHQPANDAQKTALYSFAYNEGTGALRGSTLLKLFNQGLTATAATHFMDWIFVGHEVSRGLQNRRKVEMAVFLGQVEP